MGLHSSGYHTKMVQIISNFAVDHMSPSEKGWGADVQNRDRDTVIIMFLFYRREGYWSCVLGWGGREKYMCNRNLKHRYQVGYINCV